MEEEDSSGVAWPHDLLLLRDSARSAQRQLLAAEVYAAWTDNIQEAMNATAQWSEVPKRASFGFCGTAHSLAAAGAEQHREHDFFDYKPKFCTFCSETLLLNPLQASASFSASAPMTTSAP
jgi:hypothetical protein